MNVTRPQAPQIAVCPLFTTAKMMSSTVMTQQANQEVNCIGRRCGFWSESVAQMPDGTTQILGKCGVAHGPNVMMGLLAQLAELTQVVQADAAAPTQEKKE